MFLLDMVHHRVDDLENHSLALMNLVNVHHRVDDLEIHH